jgi:hypothetical protein
VRKEDKKEGSSKRKQVKDNEGQGTEQHPEGKRDDKGKEKEGSEEGQSAKAQRLNKKTSTVPRALELRSSEGDAPLFQSPSLSRPSYPPPRPTLPVKDSIAFLNLPTTSKSQPKLGTRDKSRSPRISGNRSPRISEKTPEKSIITGSKPIAEKNLAVSSNADLKSALRVWKLMWTKFPVFSENYFSELRDCIKHCQNKQHARGWFIRLQV